MLHVFDTMGTTVSLDVADESATGTQRSAAAFAAIEELFHSADERFSLYKPESELSRIAAGELALSEASAELLEVYAQSVDWLLQTDGAFTPHRPDGIIDLSGIVKAWAMDRAAEVLRAHGLLDWALNVGGDVVCSGSPGGGRPWVIGIVDPVNRSSLVTAIALGAERPALATSGSGERGDHIWRTVTHPVATYSQASVAAAHIVTADVLATAIISGGEEARDRITQRWDVDVMTIGIDGTIAMTPRMRAAMQNHHGSESR